jgi:ribosomal subunit interface protein
MASLDNPAYPLTSYRAGHKVPAFAPLLHIPLAEFVFSHDTSGTMQLSVTGKQLDVGDALRQHAEINLTASVAKYFDGAIEGSVVFSREAHLFRADIFVHVGHGIQIQGQGEADDPYPAFDMALEHAAKQMRRHKRKLRSHHRVDSSPEQD